MRKIVCIVLTLAMLLTAVQLTAFSATAESYVQNTVSIDKIKAFEGTPTGYTSGLTTKDGKTVRTVSRTGDKDTSVNFNLYLWSAITDINDEFIPLGTANYINIEYYYQSPDAAPALSGSHMRWTPGRAVMRDNTSSLIEVFWSAIPSRNTFVANKWATMTIPLSESNSYLAQQQKYGDDYVLSQFKFYPLEADMGVKDVLYIGNVTFQSWDPDVEIKIETRKIGFYSGSKADSSEAADVATIEAKDLEYITIPKFDDAYLPMNAKFLYWAETDSGLIYKPGDSYRVTKGKDTRFDAVYGYNFDFGNVTGGYITGYEDGSFRPQNNMTRAEACTILSRIIGIDGASIKEKSAYADISENDWYYSDILKLESLGALDFIKGDFKPNQNITRGELVRIIYNVTSKECDNMKLTFTDIASDSEYFKSIVYAVSNGIVTGYEDGSFRPENNITRAEVVTIINRFIGRTPTGTGNTTFSDISGHWAEGQILASAGDKDSAWTVGKASEYMLEGVSAKEYITALQKQSQTLSADAIRNGVDVIADKMKSDILETKDSLERPENKTYYVSNNGNDSNDGKTPATAWATLTKVNNASISAGSTILFEREGIWRGQIRAKSDVKYGAYGEGEKPLFLGSPHDYADSSYWKETEYKNIYVCTEAIRNAGILAFDHDVYDHGNYNELYGKNRILKSQISGYKDLKNDLEFFSDMDTNKLYLYSADGNPGKRFKSIEIGTKVDIFDGAPKNCTIDNLAFKFTGSHGIGFGSCSNITVTNCVFSWIGGSILGDTSAVTTQYGNAVEIFGNCDGYYVSNNWMYQIYDTAITHQYSGKGTENCTEKNIEYTKNLMEYVHWGIEFYISQSSSNTATRYMENYYAGYNLLRHGGYGWGSIVTNRQDSARLYSCSSIQKNDELHSEYNIIDRCTGYLLDINKNSSERFENNIYIQVRGNTLGTLRGTTCKCYDDAGGKIREFLGDNGAVVLVVKE